MREHNFRLHGHRLAAKTSNAKFVIMCREFSLQYCLAGLLFFFVLAKQLAWSKVPKYLKSELIYLPKSIAHQIRCYLFCVYWKALKFVLGSQTYYFVVDGFHSYWLFYIFLLFQLHRVCSDQWTLHGWLQRVCIGLNVESLFLFWYSHNNSQEKQLQMGSTSVNYSWHSSVSFVDR